jgi:hypothetical protein
MNGDNDAFWDSLDAYEIAVLVFTSPSRVEPDHREAPSRILTGKIAYLWAGAIANAIEHNPQLTPQDVLAAFKAAAEKIGPGVRDLVLRRFVSEPIRIAELETYFFRLFLDYLGRGDAWTEIIERTEQAAQHLEWRGLIEDPFSKKVAGLVLSAVTLLPFSYTEQKGELNIQGLSWEYTQRAKPDGSVDRHVRFKVREATKVVLDEFVPTIVRAAGTLTEQDEMSVSEIQQKLKTQGYYVGPIDGVFGPRTKQAVKNFQAANNIPQTGYATPETVKALRG